MPHRRRQSGHRLVAIALAIVVGVLPATVEALTVRVHDAVGQPGGLIAVVLRTYASRPIGQGQLCLESTPTAPGLAPPALNSTEGSEVFSVLDDATTALTADLVGDPQQIVLQFESPSATVNATDGPMAVLYLRLGADVVPGQTYVLSLDPLGTSFIGDAGEIVQVTPRSGTLTIRAPDDPIRVEAHGEDATPGSVARLSMVTFEPILLSGGQVAIRYDPAVAAGPPVTLMDPRHGNATFVASTPMPGLVVVSFQSPDSSLNGVPGDLIEVLLPTSPTVPPGTLSPLALDPMLTFLVDAQGQPLSLDFVGNVLEFIAPVPGSASDLTLGKMPGEMLELVWNPDCGSSTTYALYRGDLLQGYPSLAPEPGYCDLATTGAAVAAGPGNADFFLVVPHLDGQEGGYGFNSAGEARFPATLACYPQTDFSDCAP